MDNEFNVKNWKVFCSFARWYPDLFLDLIKPEKGGLNLHTDQRVFLRSVVRFSSFNGTFTRGYGKTFDEVLASILLCVFYPGINISLTAQTKENAKKLLNEKYREIMKFYPMLGNEIIKVTSTKSDFAAVFKNGSCLDNLANSQSSKGLRRHRIECEESALVDRTTFDDALKPIVEVPRLCVGKYSLKDPEELNQQINFFTTAGFKGSDEYERMVKAVKSMANLDGTLVLGSAFWLPCWYGRGSSKSEIFQKKQDMSYVSFLQNYMSEWVGSSENELVHINKLMSCRSLTRTEVYANDSDEYYVAVDVARSQNTNNNKTSVCVLKVRRNKDSGTILSIDVVYVVNMANNLNFTAQACKIKEIRNRYKTKGVVIDGNGLGAGLIDECLKNSFSPETGENLGCWDTTNDDNIPESPYDAEPILYNLKAQSAQSKIVSNFISMVEGGKLRLLVHKDLYDFTVAEHDDFENKVAPFFETDALFEEIANLKLKTLGNGGLTVEKTVKRIDKDRASALMYGLWYINEFYRDIGTNEEYGYCCFVN